MHYNIVHPTRADLLNPSPEEIKNLKKFLTYTNKGIQFEIMAHRKRNWLKKKDPIGWEKQMEELKANLKGCVLHEDDGVWVRPGSIPYIFNEGDTASSAIVRPKPHTLPWKKAPDFEPYPYQSSSVEALLKVRHGNVALPTGCGKSFILLLLSKHFGKDVVVVTPSKSIFNELLTEFQKRLGAGKVGGYGDGKKDIKKPITIAIGKSLTMLKEGTPQYDFFKKKKIMLVDESHTFAANQLESVCHGVLNDAAYRIFVSATQTRNDGTEKLLQSIIGKTVFEMSLDNAISQGYLCPLNFHIINTLSKHTEMIKDPIKSKRTHFLYNENIAKLAAQIGNASWRVNQESTLILVEELRQIQMLTKLLEVPFAYVHSCAKKDDLERFGLEKVKLQDQVDKFNNGEVKVLIGTSCVATGTNIFPTHNTVNWMGGSSEIVTKQGPMGRSTRLLEKSEYAHLHKPKPFTRIFDFKLHKQLPLNKQLDKRISWYEEAKGYVKFF